MYNQDRKMEYKYYLYKYEEIDRSESIDCEIQFHLLHVRLIPNLGEIYMGVLPSVGKERE